MKLIQRHLRRTLTAAAALGALAARKLRRF
jgi:hypothetical protein